MKKKGTLNARKKKGGTCTKGKKRKKAASAVCSLAKKKRSRPVGKGEGKKSIPSSYRSWRAPKEKKDRLEKSAVTMSHRSEGKTAWASGGAVFPNTISSAKTKKGAVSRCGEKRTQKADFSFINRESERKDQWGKRKKTSASPDLAKKKKPESKRGDARLSFKILQDWTTVPKKEGTEETVPKT